MSKSPLDGRSLDITALLAEVDQLPNPQRCLLTHNERVLIDFCNRLGAALRSQSRQPETDGFIKATEGLMP